MRTSSTRRGLIAALTAGALVAAGCGENKLDTGDAEKKISDEIFDQRNVRPEKVDCPSDMTAEKDKTYRCEITAPGGDKIGATVTMTDDDGGFRFEVDQK